MKGKLNGLAMRVPILNGSIIDFVAELGKKVSVEEVNKKFKKFSKGKMNGILEYSGEELVSSDILGNPHSSIVDGLSTQIVGSKKGRLVKVLSWYDNEWGYSNRLVDVVKRC